MIKRYYDSFVSCRDDASLFIGSNCLFVFGLILTYLAFQQVKPDNIAGAGGGAIGSFAFGGAILWFLRHQNRVDPSDPLEQAKQRQAALLAENSSSNNSEIQTR